MPTSGSTAPQFKALGSTAAVDARDHTGTTFTDDEKGIPIYWLGGAKVTDDYEDFYDGMWDSNAPTDESGTAIASPATVEVFTGSEEDGTKFDRNDRFLGTTGNTVRVGEPGGSGDELSSGVEAKGTSLAFYGLSGVFTVIDPPTAAPELESATVDGQTLKLTYDQALDTGSEPDSGDFTVTAGGTSVTVSAVSISGLEVTLTLATAVAPGQTVTISYTPGTNPIRNGAETDAAGLTDESVTNNTLPVLSIADAQGSEGEAIQFTVTLSPASTQAVTVSYQTSGDTATEDTDYTAASGTLTISAGDTTETISVQTTEDTSLEGHETFQLTLSSATNTKLDGGASTLVVTGTIQDDDLPTGVEVPETWSLAPAGLTAGATFRLLFVSSTTRNGSNTAITTYDSHVQTAAASGHTDVQSNSTHFKALGSTATVDARDNTSTTITGTYTGVPIYWLDGDKVADDYSDFYDGDWGLELAEERIRNSGCSWRDRLHGV